MHKAGKLVFEMAHWASWVGNLLSKEFGEGLMSSM
jgi:hypothetical protein